MPSIVIGDVQVSGTTMTAEVRVRPGSLSLFTYEGELVVSRLGTGTATVRKDFSGSSSGDVESKNVTIDMSQFSNVEGETFVLTANLLSPNVSSYQLEVEVQGDSTTEDPVIPGDGSDGSDGSDGGTGGGVAGTGLTGVQIAAGLGAVAGSAYLADRYMG